MSGRGRQAAGACGAGAAGARALLLCAVLLAVPAVSSAHMVHTLHRRESPAVGPRPHRVSSAHAAHAARRHPVKLLAIRMIDARVGWAVGEHAVLRTADGGTEWRDVTPRGLRFAATPSVAMNFLSARVGCVVSQSGATMFGTTIACTGNGGRTWHHTSLRLPATSFGIQQIDLVDARHGWLLANLGVAGGFDGVQIFRTGDGGAHWTSVAYTNAAPGRRGSLPFAGYKSGIGFRDALTGFTTGAASGPRGFTYLYMTDDGGRTWRHRALTLPRSHRRDLPLILPPQFFSRRDGILPVTFNLLQLVYVTHNGGRTWLPTRLLPRALVPDFVDVRHGWAIENVATGGRGGRGGRLYVTRDSGRHWATIVPRDRLPQGATLDFVTLRIGFAIRVGYDGADPTTLFKTTDGGRTWRRLTPYTVR